MKADVEEVVRKTYKLTQGKHPEVWNELFEQWRINVVALPRWPVNERGLLCMQAPVTA